MSTAAWPQAHGSRRASTARRGKEQLLPKVMQPSSLQRGTRCAVPPPETRPEPSRTDPIIRLGENIPHQHHTQVSLADSPRLLENRSAQGKLDAQDIAAPGSCAPGLGSVGQELKKKASSKEVPILAPAFCPESTGTSKMHKGFASQPFQPFFPSGHSFYSPSILSNASWGCTLRLLFPTSCQVL